MKAGGRAGIVIKNTFLSNADNASVNLRKLLLETCNLHTILELPSGTFHGAGVKTVVLFFQKGAPTHNVWVYQLDPARNLGKTNALNDEDVADFLMRQKTFAQGTRSWTVILATKGLKNFDLTLVNPNERVEPGLKHPAALLDEIEMLDASSKQILKNLRDLL